MAVGRHSSELPQITFSTENLFAKPCGYTLSLGWPRLRGLHAPHSRSWTAAGTPHPAFQRGTFPRPMDRGPLNPTLETMLSGSFLWRGEPGIRPDFPPPIPSSHSRVGRQPRFDCSEEDLTDALFPAVFDLIRRASAFVV